MQRVWNTTVSALAACLLATASATAAAPTVESVAPGVGPRGREFSVVLAGGRLKEARELVFYEKGLACRALKATSDNEARATLYADPDCRLGAHPFRLRTDGGLSEVRVVHVTPFPVVAEVEPNDDPSAAAPVPLGTTVAGVVDSGDVDGVAVQLRKGARFSAEVQAIRLGGEMTDAVLALVGPDGRQILQVDDAPITRQDPSLSIVAPSDGRYVLQIRDTAFGGGPGATYALHVGDFPRPRALMPPGGQAGKEGRIRLVFSEGDAVEETVAFPSDAGPWWNYHPRIGESRAPVATPIRVRPYHGFDESPAGNPAREWPVAFHGVVAEPNEVDVFAIEAREGEQIQVEVFAERVGAPLDSLLAIRDPDGDLVSRNDDDDCHDSRLVFQARTSGVHKIEISDKRLQGGADYVYRIEVEQPKPGLELFLAGPLRKTQTRQVVAVPRGNRVTAYLAVRRDGFDAPVKIEAEGLPKGVSVDVPTVPAGSYLVPIVVEAAADAPLGATLASLKGIADTKAGTIVGGFRQNVVLIPANGDGSYESIALDRLAFVVTDEKQAPYRVTLEAPKAALARDGAIEVVANIRRSPGFEDPIEVNLPHLPPGVEIEGPIVLPAGKTQAVFRLFARPDADPTDWRLAAEIKTAPPRRDRREMTLALMTAIDPTALGAGGGGRRRRAPIEGAPEVASAFVPIELKGASVSGKLEPAAGEQGGTVRVVCSLDFGATPVDAFTATLEGLPPRATASPVPIVKGAKRVEFQVAIGATTPLGEHDALLCRLTGAVDGRAVVYQVGRGGSLKVAPAGALTLGPDGKPLGPLEALRRREARSQ